MASPPHTVWNRPVLVAQFNLSQNRNQWTHRTNRQKLHRTIQQMDEKMQLGAQQRYVRLRWRVIFPQQLQHFRYALPGSLQLILKLTLQGHLKKIPLDHLQEIPLVLLENVFD